MKPFPPNGNRVGTYPDAGEVEKACSNLLDALGIDQEHRHTRGTARRMARVFTCEALHGRYAAPPDFTRFRNDSQVDEMVVLGPITVRSMCAHHFCPFTGECYVGYIPDEWVAGASKFSRLTAWLAARPQIQEELTQMLAENLTMLLKPKGLGVMMRCTHTCMTWRGIKEHTAATMQTSALRGVIKDKPEARAEFFAMIPQLSVGRSG